MPTRKKTTQTKSEPKRSRVPELPDNDDKRADLQKDAEDSGGEFLTTNQGVRINDNQNSLKAGDRGPTLLEDFILREKITHFDHRWHSYRDSIAHYQKGLRIAWPLLWRVG